MLGHEVVGKRGLRGIVLVVILLGSDPGIVRRIQRHVGQERLSFLLPLEEVDCRVGEKLDAVFAAGSLLGQLSLGPEVLNREGIRIVAHAAQEDVPPFLEGAQKRRGLVVPFPGDERGISRLGEGFRPCGLAVKVLFDPEEGAAGQEHRARWDADGPLLSPHAIGAGEGGALGHQPIEIRRLDRRIPECVNRVGPLVVAEDEDNIGGRCGLGRESDGGDEVEEQDGPSQLHD